MRIYLAGPEVFLSNAHEILAAKKKLCQEHGHEGVTPFDADIGELKNDMECGIRIAAANERLIDSCDVVIANITPFRSQNADPGTVFELGYARAKGKKLLAYSHGGSRHVERIAQLYAVKEDGAFLRERDTGLSIDDFGMVENAMIDGGISLSNGVICVRESGGSIVEKLYSTRGLDRCLRFLNGDLSIH